MRETHRSAGVLTVHHEQANWFRGDPDLRPFDTIYKVEPGALQWQVQDVTIGDPTRIGKIPIQGRFHKMGAPGQIAADLKYSKHKERLSEVGPTTKPVEYKVVAFESGGGWTKDAVQWLNNVSAARDQLLKAKKARVFKWTSWTAMTWKVDQIQRITFEIVKGHANGALHGLRETSKLYHGTAVPVSEDVVVNDFEH